MGDNYIVPGDLDAALCDMIRAAEETIVAWLGDNVGLSDLHWDHPAVLDLAHSDGDARRTAEAIDDIGKVNHATGFICGVAAGLNVTPLTLLDSYEDKTDNAEGEGDGAMVALAAAPTPRKRKKSRKKQRA